MKIRIQVTGQPQLRRLARRLRRAADGGLAADLQAELVRPARPVLRVTRQGVRRASFPAVEPSGNPRHRSTGLRERLAAATDISVLSSPPGVRFSVDGDVVLPGRGRAGHQLAKYSAGLKPRWRHQSFGSWDHPVTQLPEDWFTGPIRAEEPRFADGVRRAMQRTAERIEGA